jgi:hypothetical protein
MVGRNLDVIRTQSHSEKELQEWIDRAECTGTRGAQAHFDLFACHSLKSEVMEASVERLYSDFGWIIADRHCFWSGELFAREYLCAQGMDGPPLTQ